MLTDSAQTTNTVVVTQHSAVHTVELSIVSAARRQSGRPCGHGIDVASECTIQICTYYGPARVDVVQCTATARVSVHLIILAQA